MSYAESFMEYLDNEGLQHSDIEQHENDIKVIRLSTQTDNTNVSMIFIFNDDVFSIHCYGIAKIPDQKYMDMLVLCNELNDSYKFSKFSIDDDNDLKIEIDTMLSEDFPAKKMFHLVILLMNIVDKAYPQVMKTLWG